MKVQAQFLILAVAASLGLQAHASSVFGKMLFNPNANSKAASAELAPWSKAFAVRLAPGDQDPPKSPPVRYATAKVHITKMTVDIVNGEPVWNFETVCTQQIAAVPVYDLRGTDEYNVDVGYVGCDTTLKDSGPAKIWVASNLMIMSAFDPGFPGDRKNYMAVFAVTPPDWDPARNPEVDPITKRFAYSTLSTRTLNLGDALFSLSEYDPYSDEVKASETFTVSIEILDETAKVAR